MATILPANIDFGDVSAHDFGAKKGEVSQVINRELLSFRCAGPEQRGQYYRLVLKGDDVMNGKSALLLRSAQDKSPPLGYVLGNIEGNTPLLCDQGDPSIGLTHPNGLTWQKKESGNLNPALTWTLCQIPGTAPHWLHSGTYTGKGQITLYLP